MRTQLGLVSGERASVGVKHSSQGGGNGLAVEVEREVPGERLDRLSGACLELSQAIAKHTESESRCRRWAFDYV
eukprot:3935150-Rhodomonas_salina.2